MSAAPGWYPASDGPWLRWWDGARWTSDTRPLPGPVEQQQPAVVVQRGPSRSVSKERKSTSHTFHLVMTFCTFGLWGIFVWFPLWAWHAWGPKKRVVTKYK